MPSVARGQLKHKEGWKLTLQPQSESWWWHDGAEPLSKMVHRFWWRKRRDVRLYGTPAVRVMRKGCGQHKQKHEIHVQKSSDWTLRRGTEMWKQCLLSSSKVANQTDLCSQSHGCCLTFTSELKIAFLSFSLWTMQTPSSSRNPPSPCSLFC